MFDALENFPLWKHVPSTIMIWERMNVLCIETLQWPIICARDMWIECVICMQSTASSNGCRWSKNSDRNFTLHLATMMAFTKRYMLHSVAFSQPHNADITYCLFSAVALLFFPPSLSPCRTHVMHTIYHRCLYWMRQNINFESIKSHSNISKCITDTWAGALNRRDAIARK